MARPARSQNPAPASAPSRAITNKPDTNKYDAVACAYELTGPNNEPLNWVTRPAQHDATLERLIETNSFAVTGVFRLDALRRLATLPSPPARPGDIFDESIRVLED